MLKKMFTALAASVILTLGMSVAHASETNVPRESVYRIGGYLDRSHCSSVAIGPKLILTADHCVADNLALQIINFDENYKESSTIHAKLTKVKQLPEYDQALFSVNSPVELKYTRLCERELEEGDFGKPLTAVGFPLVITKLETKGTFQGYMDLSELMGQEYKPFYLANLPIAGGNSGGGVFRVEGSKEGEAQWCLTGLATANTYRQGYESMTWFSSLTGLKKLTSGIVLTDEQQAARSEFQNRVTNPSDEK